MQWCSQNGHSQNVANVGPSLGVKEREGQRPLELPEEDQNITDALFDGRGTQAQHWGSKCLQRTFDAEQA